MSDLRDQTTGELLLSLKATAWRYSQTRTTRDARILANGAAVVLRELDAAEAERDRLRLAWQSARQRARSMTQNAEDWHEEHDQQRQRAEQAEAERDRLRARLTGVAIHAHRLTKRIGPGTPAWSALADLRAALDQPADQTKPGHCAHCHTPYATCREEGALCCVHCRHEQRWPSEPGDQEGAEQ